MAKSFGTTKKKARLLDFLDRGHTVIAKRYCDTPDSDQLGLLRQGVSSLSTTEPSSELTAGLQLVMVLRMESYRPPSLQRRTAAK